MTKSVHRLSKSRFMSGLECRRKLWLSVNQPQDAREPDLATKHRMDVGTAFGRDVTRLFPGGVEIEADYRHPKEALEQTAVELAGNAPALFEAAFLHQDTLIRADILVRSKSDPSAWNLIEVKSASNSAGSRSRRNSKLEKHISDMAVQLHVLKGAGYTVESTSLAWVNSAYERAGDLDWNALVAIEDETEAVRARALAIGPELDDFLDLIDEPTLPGAEFGKTKCGNCDFFNSCWGHLPADSVLQLPRISAKALGELQAMGVGRIPQIPVDFGLTDNQAAMREAYDHPRGIVVEPEPLAQWIDDLVYPLHCFDFETWNPCIPPFDRTRPYMQIPFQYSLHIVNEPGAEPTHREFLASGQGDDPRAELIAQLTRDIGPVGSIVVHHASFELARLRELAAYSPEHETALLALCDRIVDTEIPFTQNWYLHPGLMGRSSIKVVLPTLVPGLAYSGMDIAEGSTASIRFEEIFDGKVTGKAAEKVRRDLIEYCALDTMAMVKIVERLCELVA